MRVRVVGEFEGQLPVEDGQVTRVGVPLGSSVASPSVVLGHPEGDRVLVVGEGGIELWSVASAPPERVGYLPDLIGLVAAGFSADGRLVLVIVQRRARGSVFLYGFGVDDLAPVTPLDLAAMVPEVRVGLAADVVVDRGVTGDRLVLADGTAVPDGTAWLGTVVVRPDHTAGTLRVGLPRPTGRRVPSADGPAAEVQLHWSVLAVTR